MFFHISVRLEWYQSTVQCLLKRKYNHFLFHLFICLNLAHMRFRKYYMIPKQMKTDRSRRDIKCGIVLYY